MTFQNELTFLTHQQAGTVEAFHDAYERAVKTVRGNLGRTHPLRIGGRTLDTPETFTVVNPADTDEVVGTFARAGAAEVDRAVAAAKEALPAWRATPYEERAALFEEAAEIMRTRKFDLAALMTLENGKNRYEAAADVDEAIDFLRFYSAEMRRNGGYVDDTGQPTPTESTESVLRPYGVFAVVAPFNFPLAILVGMTTGAVVTGNTAVVKPASATPTIAHAFFDILAEAGLPAGVANLITGSGREAGQPLLEHPDIAGVVFTGSRAVGLGIKRTFLELEKTGPVIAELGGKNAVVVSENADLEAAVEGTWKAAFGFGGQKCSAASRAYVHRSLYDDFLAGLKEAAEAVVMGAPEDRGTFLGPVVDDSKVAEYEEVMATVERDGGTIVAGGRVRTDGAFADGRFVTPTVLADLPRDHEVVMTELFLPVIVVLPFDELDEAIDEVNRVDYGLTGGIFSTVEADVQRYFERAEVGVVYANRRASATTGALVQAQPFVGWKMSGTTGKAAGGKYYLPQFLREQARTVWTD